MRLALSQTPAGVRQVGGRCPGHPCRGRCTRLAQDPSCRACWHLAEGWGRPDSTDPGTPAPRVHASCPDVNTVGDISGLREQKTSPGTQTASANANCHVTSRDRVLTQPPAGSRLSGRCRAAVFGNPASGTAAGAPPSVLLGATALEAAWASAWGRAPTPLGFRSLGSQWGGAGSSHLCGTPLGTSLCSSGPGKRPRSPSQ